MEPWYTVGYFRWNGIYDGACTVGWDHGRCKNRNVDILKSYFARLSAETHDKMKNQNSSVGFCLALTPPLRKRLAIHTLVLNVPELLKPSYASQQPKPHEPTHYSCTQQRYLPPSFFPSWIAAALCCNRLLVDSSRTSSVHSIDFEISIQFHFEFWNFSHSLKVWNQFKNQNRELVLVS